LLGDFSYLIYLIHFLIGFAVEVTWLESGVRGSKVFWSSQPWVIGAASAIHVTLDSCLERWRRRVKLRVQNAAEKCSEADPILILWCR
jgi:peptidoglycan/LPS O-acetylase OafA/YrhL